VKYEMLWLGMILGCLVGFLLAWWFACKGSPLEPFFRRLLRLERNSASLNSRLILYDLQAGVEDLSTKVQRLDLGLQKLLDSIQEYQFLYKDSKKVDRADVAPLSPDVKKDAGNPERLELCWEVERLFREGLTTSEIAQKLKIGKGEVELVLSLGKKPFWVIDAKNDFNKGN
jgi:hypothetical protein